MNVENSKNEEKIEYFKKTFKPAMEKICQFINDGKLSFDDMQYFLLKLFIDNENSFLDVFYLNDKKCKNRDNDFFENLNARFCTRYWHYEHYLHSGFVKLNDKFLKWITENAKSSTNESKADKKSE